MPLLSYKTTIEVGDLVLAFIGRENIKPIKITLGETLNTRYGTFPHDSMVDLPYGSQITSPKGHGFIYLLHPTPELWTNSLPHRTQIVYTPDSSYIMQRLNCVAGSRVIEAGTGSGSFSHAFARNISTVDNKGKLFSYEFHEPRYVQAKEEFESHGLANIVLTNRDVCNDGFEVFDSETNSKIDIDADIVFLDLPAPWEAIPNLDTVIAKDRRVGICCFSPCIEQVVKTVEALQANGWTDVEMTEISGKKWESRKEMVREIDDALERLRDVMRRQKEGIEKIREIAQKSRQNKALKEEQRQLEEQSADSETDKKRPAEKEEDTKKTKKQKKQIQKEKEKDYGFNPFGKGRRINEGDPDFNWFDVSKTGPEVKTHTSYLTFAYLVPDVRPAQEQQTEEELEQKNAQE